MQTKLLILILALAIASPICAEERNERDSAPAGKSLFEKPVKLEADGEPINLKPEDAEECLKGWHACPAFHDVDGDGKVDLVSGEHFGRIWIFRNAGSNAQPVYEKPYALQQTGGGDLVVPGTC